MNARAIILSGSSKWCGKLNNININKLLFILVTAHGKNTYVHFIGGYQEKHILNWY